MRHFSGASITPLWADGLGCDECRCTSNNNHFTGAKAVAPDAARHEPVARVPGWAGRECVSRGEDRPTGTKPEVGAWWRPFAQETPGTTVDLHVCISFLVPSEQNDNIPILLIKKPRDRGHTTSRLPSPRAGRFCLFPITLNAAVLLKVTSLGSWLFLRVRELKFPCVVTRTLVFYITNIDWVNSKKRKKIRQQIKYLGTGAFCTLTRKIDFEMS